MLGKLLNTGVSANMKIKVFKALESKINDPASADAIRSESVGLCAVTTKIDEALYHTGKYLENDGHDLKGEFQALRKEWFTSLHIEYAELLWQSRDELGRIESVLDDFTSNVFEYLSDDGVSPLEKSKAIAGLQIVATQGRLRSDAWNKFLANLKAFDQKFTSIGLGNSTVGPEVEELTHKIANLSTELESSDNLLNQAASSGANTGESVQALIALHYLAPLATGRALLAGTKAADGEEDPQISKALAKKTDITPQISELDKQVEQKIDGLNDAAKTKASLDRSLRLAESIKDRMHNILGPVLGMHVADLQNLAKASFGAAITQDGTTEARLGLMLAAYKSVSHGLRAYSTTLVQLPAV